MEGPVEGQVAIVTGAGQGIGRAIALRLARDGMDLVLGDLKQDLIEKVAKEIEGLGRKAVPLKLDVTLQADRQNMVVVALKEFNRLDLLVNNAGVQMVALPLDVTEEHWDTVMGVNARAVYFCCQEVLRHMVPRKSGRIINISSAAGKTASTIQHPVYNISKAAVLAMTKTLGLAFAGDGIRINAVCPGVVDTPMQDLVDREFGRVAGKDPQLIRQERVSRIPIGRIEQPEDIAAVVSFLAGPDSGYMVAQAINVTGGLVTY